MTNEEKVVALVDTIAKAMGELSTIWAKEGGISDILNDVKTYPFGASFDDVSFSVFIWAEDVRSVLSQVAK